MSSLILREEPKEKCFCPVSNWGPFACEANVITTTLQKRTAASPHTSAPYCVLFWTAAFVGSSRVVDSFRILMWQTRVFALPVRVTDYICVAAFLPSLNFTLTAMSKHLESGSNTLKSSESSSFSRNTGTKEMYWLISNELGCRQAEIQGVLAVTR